MLSGIKTLWINRLLDPEFQKTVEHLHTPEGFCALGALCQLFIEANPAEETDPDMKTWADSGSGFYSIAKFTDKLPENVQRWSQLYISIPNLVLTNSNAVPNGTPFVVKLTKINDGIIMKTGDTMYSLSEIAGFINDQL